MARTAKLFMNGRSQAVRLPAEFRFDGDEVLIRKDETTGDVILSEKTARQKSWEGFLEARALALAAGEIDDDFLNSQERDQGKLPPDPFEGWEE
jgi:antitoxin VapB